MHSSTSSQVYLLHFTSPYKHAKHYLGVAENLDVRLSQHRSGCGARLTQVVLEHGGSWVLARTWSGGRSLEKKLKGYHSGVKLCPICQGKTEALPCPPLSLSKTGRRAPLHAPTRYFP